MAECVKEVNQIRLVEKRIIEMMEEEADKQEEKQIKRRVIFENLEHLIYQSCHERFNPGQHHERVLVTRRKARLGMNIFWHKNREENKQCDCTCV